MYGKVQAELNAALTKMDNDKYQSAISNLDEAIQLDSMRLIFYYFRGACYKMIGEYENAERDFKMIIKQDENILEAHLELCKTQYLESKFEEAKKSIIKAIRIDSKNEVAHMLLGELMLKLQDLDKAQKSFERAVELNPDYSDAQFKIALIQILKQKDLQLIISHLDKIIASDSLHAESLIYRSHLNLVDKPDSSLSDLNKLINGSPLNLNFRLWRAFVLIELEKYHEGFFDLQKVFIGNPQNENNFIGKQTIIDKRLDLYYASEYTLANLYSLPEKDIDRVKKAFCLIATEKYEQSISILREIESYASSPLCLFLAGVAHEHLGKHEIAWRHYDLAILRDSSIVDAYKKTAIYNTNIQNWNEAEKRFSKVLELNPKLSNMYKLRGVTRYHQSDFEGAIEDFTAYLRNDSTDKETLTNRAFAFEKLGEYDKAIEDRLKIEGFFPHKYFDFSNTINVILNSGDTVKAIHYLDRYTLKNLSTDATILKIKLLISQKSWFRAAVEVENGLNGINHSGYFNDQYSYLLYAKGLVLMQKEKKNEAEEFFSKALEINNGYADAYLERGKLYLMQGKKYLARKDFEMCLKLGMGQAEKLLREL